MRRLPWVGALAILLGTAPLVAPVAAQPAYFGGGTSAVTPADSARDAELDILAAEIASKLRCPVCRGQSVQESSSQLAREMQALIRQKLEAGETPEEIEAFFVASYGDFILLRPPAEGLNALVYLLPLAVFLLALSVIAWKWASRRRAEPAAERVSDPRTERVPRDSDALSERDRSWLDAQIRGETP